MKKQDFILETKRLVLREITVTDAEVMFDLNSDSEVIKYTGDDSFKSIGEAKYFLDKYSDYQRNGYGRWAVILKSESRVLGWCGLKKRDDGVIDLGFRFFKKDWGKGYATEAAEGCLKLGFNQFGMTEIIGQAAVANTGSIRVLEKLNMKYWKLETDQNGLEESVIYRINKMNYLEL